MQLRFKDLFSNRRKSAASMPIPAEVLSGLDKNDCFIVSFPRSGNTWMRHLVQEAILQTRPDLPRPESIDVLIPTAHQDHWARSSDAVPGQAYGLSYRIFKSHNIRDVRPFRVIYLFRDPVDALVSFFHHRTNRAAVKGSEPPQEGIETFCRDVLPQWCEHVEMAIEHARRQPERIVLLAYEELAADALAAFERVASFLDLKISRSGLSAAVEMCEFSRLQQREVERKPIIGEKKFFRKGRVGGGREELAASLAAEIDRIAGPVYREAMRQATLG